MLRMPLFYAAVFAAVPAMSLAATTENPVSVNLAKDATWTEFRFDLNNGNGIWRDGEAAVGEGLPLPDPISFDFTLNEKSTLQITDAFRWGDAFRVYNNGTQLGETSTPTDRENVGNDYFRDFDAAFASPDWSSGSWDLEPGDYSITGYVFIEASVKGRAALRLIDFTANDDDFTDNGEPSTATPVPLPATLPMMMAAGIALAAVSTRRKKTK